MVDILEANFDQVSDSQIKLSPSILHEFEVLFPSDPKRVRLCNMGKLRLPLRGEKCGPLVVRERRTKVSNYEKPY